MTVAFLLLRHDEVERVGRRLLTEARDPDRAAEMTWMVGYTFMRTGRVAEASATVREALARVGLGEVWTARLTALDALLQLVQGLPDGDASMLDDALVVAQRSGDALAIGYALHVLSLYSGTQRDILGMLERVSRGLAVLGDDAQTSDLRLLMYAHRVGGLSVLDRSAEAIDAGREALVLAERAGTPRLANTRFSLGEQYFVVGQWDDALIEIDPAVGLPGPDYLPIMIHGLMALIAAHRADWETADAHLSGMPDWSGIGGVALPNVHYLLMAQALRAERAGRYRDAAEILAIAIDPELAEAMTERSLLLPALARTAVALADQATLAAAAEAAQQEAEHDQLPLKIAIADLCRGLRSSDPGPVLLGC